MRWLNLQWILSGVLVAAGGLLILQTAFLPDEQLSFLQWGLLQIIYTYEESLPLLALGVSLTKLTWWARLAVIVVCVLTAIAGQFVETSLIPWLGPFNLVVGGVVLAMPRKVNDWTVPVLASFLVLAISMITSFNAPAEDAWLPFALGSALSSAWILALAFLVSGAIPISWLRIATPIVGSWFAAMGLLLGATILAPERPQPAPIAVHPPRELEKIPQP
jgi:hypothetical protein